MREVGELAGVAQEDVREDLQAMFRGAIRAALEVFLEQARPGWASPPALRLLGGGGVGGELVRVVAAADGPRPHRGTARDCG